MVDLDLRKLSAPVEALRPALIKAYQRLDAKWDEITNCLKALPIPCTISYVYESSDMFPEDCNCIEWKKWSGKKRVCIVMYRHDPSANPHSDYDCTTTPYEEWSGQQRSDMLAHVPRLFEAAQKQTKEFIEKTKN